MADSEELMEEEKSRPETGGLAVQVSAFSFCPRQFSRRGDPHAIYGRRGDLRFSFSAFVSKASALSFCFRGLAED